MVYQIQYKTEQKTKCLIVRSLDNVLQQQHMSIIMGFYNLFSLQRIFGDEGVLARQATLRTIMNTKPCMTLETLSDALKMIMGILKDHRDVHMRVKGSS